MRASQAKAIASETASEEMEKIYISIEMAAREKRMSIGLDSISEAAVQTLKDNGYTVIEKMLSNCCLYTISWG